MDAENMVQSVQLCTTYGVELQDRLRKLSTDPDARLTDEHLSELDTIASLASDVADTMSSIAEDVSQEISALEDQRDVPA